MQVWTQRVRRKESSAGKKVIWWGQEERRRSSPFSLSLFLPVFVFLSALDLRYPLLSKGLEQAFAGATRHFNNACSTNFTKESQTEGVGAGSFPCYVPVHYTGEGEQGHNIEKTENVPHQCGLGANPGVNAIDLLHDTRHLCTRLRTDGIKAVSRGFSGGNLPKQEIAVEFDYSKQQNMKNFLS